MVAQLDVDERWHEVFEEREYVLRQGGEDILNFVRFQFTETVYHRTSWAVNPGVGYRQALTEMDRFYTALRRDRLMSQGELEGGIQQRFIKIVSPTTDIALVQSDSPGKLSMIVDSVHDLSTKLAAYVARTTMNEALEEDIREYLDQLHNLNP